ncbi:MAG TPA: hypothetical protein VGI63_10570 [Verrucomicrobiae bacterium]|jgi:hypothetical protein
MQESPFKKVLLVLLLAATVAALLLQFINSQFKPKAQTEPKKAAKADFQYRYAPPAIHVATDSQAKNSDDTEEQAPTPKISRAQAEAWLAKHNRNAMSLLAAFRALGDTNYLNEAATNFPNNPHVELAVLAHDEFPADRRKWLDLFKNSSPSNSLANYLSAQDDFKNGNKEAAVNELLAAAGKTQFDAYTTENQLDAEELYSSSGKTPIETATDAMSDLSAENIPELTTFKQLARGMADLEQQYVASGDADSAMNLVQMGMTFANELQSGDSGKYLINQMVGVADEKIMLSKLDQNTSYDFLNGQTPAQATELLNQQKAELRKLIIDFNPAQMQMMMSDSETASYMQRVKIYGEVEAMKWVIEQHPPAVPPQ